LHEIHEFGKTGMNVSEIGFGGSRIGRSSQIRTAKRGPECSSEALDSGITFYDTADIYAQGEANP